MKGLFLLAVCLLVGQSSAWTWWYEPPPEMNCVKWVPRPTETGMDNWCSDTCRLGRCDKDTNSYDCDNCREKCYCEDATSDYVEAIHEFLMSFCDDWVTLEDSAYINQKKNVDQWCMHNCPAYSALGSPCRVMCQCNTPYLRLY